MIRKYEFGMNRVSKVAVSLPRSTLARLERERHRLGVSRSALVARAIEAWLAEGEQSELEQKYVEGYLRHPEQPSADVAAAAVAAWEPWE